MRSAQIANGETIYAGNLNGIRSDARGAATLSAHQLRGYFDFGTNPADGDTATLDINGTNVVVRFKNTPTTANDVKRDSSLASATAANLFAFLLNPELTNSNQIAASAANQTLLSYLWFSLYGNTKIAVGDMNKANSALLTSFSGSTTTGGDSWNGNTMALYVQGGTVYVGGTEVKFGGGITPTITAPSSHPRIDVLTIDNSGTLAWTSGTENASPSAPTYPANKVPIVELYNVVGETELHDNENQSSSQGYIQYDVRPMVGTAFNPAAVSADLVPDGDATRNLGSSGDRWNHVYASTLHGDGSNITNLTVPNLTESLTAGEALNGTTTPVVVAIDPAGTTTAQIVGFGANNATGGSWTASTSYLAQGFVMPVGKNRLTSAKAYIAVAAGSPNYKLTAAIYAVDGSGYPTGSALGTSAEISPASASLNTFTFAAVSLTPGTTYSLVIYPTSITTINGSNCYSWNRDNTTGGAAAGVNATSSNSGSTWSTESANPHFTQVNGYFASSGAGRVVRGQGNDSNRLQVIGFVTSSVSDGASIAVQIAGVVSGFTGLTAGAKYYLSDTLGGIATSAGSTKLFVGYALSTTQLLIVRQIADSAL
jgi:hypothetical protein